MYGQLLAGEYLADGAYIPFEIHHERSGAMWGHSPTLGLDLWADGNADRLRFRNPANGEFLGNVLEQQEGRLAERELRLAAEVAVQNERDRRQIAESEVARLQAELRQLRGA